MNLFLLILSIDGPKCAHRTSSSLQTYTGLHRPINVTCFMHEGNPSELNFTWILPDQTVRKGFPLNSTSNILTVQPDHFDDFGIFICRAQNALDLVGECKINLIMGGESFSSKQLLCPHRK